MCAVCCSAENAELSLLWRLLCARHTRSLPASGPTSLIAGMSVVMLSQDGGIVTHLRRS